MEKRKEGGCEAKKEGLGSGREGETPDSEREEGKAAVEREGKRFRKWNGG